MIYKIHKSSNIKEYRRRNADIFSFFRHMFSFNSVKKFSIGYVYTIALKFYSSIKLIGEVKSKDINKHILK